MDIWDPNVCTVSVPGPGLIVTDAGADSEARQVPAVPQPAFCVCVCPLESTGNKWAGRSPGF